jgi:hypothetical protein
VSGSCCVCDPVLCATDDTGGHCEDAGCPPCTQGCPASDETRCCRSIPWLTLPEWRTPTTSP